VGAHSPPSIVGFNPPPAHAQSVMARPLGASRSDAGREILSILSARREVGGCIGRIQLTHRKRLVSTLEPMLTRSVKVPGFINP
jgi:hypothetical protein